MFSLVQADTENYEDDHQSLPDLTSNDRMPDEEPCWDLGQDDQRYIIYSLARAV